MSGTLTFSERLQEVFRPGVGGIAGLVEHLLELGSERGLRLDWHADRCRIRVLGGEPQEPVDIPLPKSVFRAILARMAALCNDSAPGSVSPYGGEGELSLGVESPTVLRVEYVNTPDEQRLEVTRVERS